MRKYIIVVVVAVVAVIGSYVAFAQSDSNNTNLRGGAMRGRGMMGGRIAMMRMCDGHRMMARAMMEGRVVSTSDGGVVVMVGNKLMKYDSGLNPVKELTMKVDYAAMEQQIQKMMDDCPGCRQMSQMQANAGYDESDPDL